MAKKILGKVRGDNGVTPHIGENGNWFIGDRDTGQPAGGITPQKGTDYWTLEDVQEIQAYIDEQIGGALSETY